MKKFEVMIGYKAISYFIVEAETEEEAIELAEEKYDEGEEPNDYNEFDIEPEIN